MKRNLLSSLGSLLASAGLSVAQTVPGPVATLPPAPTAEVVPATQTLAPTTPDVLTGIQTPCSTAVADCDHGIRLWGSAEYLLWWTSNAPSPVPLVATGPVVPNLSPVIGQPGTSVLLGGNSVSLGARSGGRFTVGGWLNNEGTVGLEGVYLFLGNQAVNQSVGSSGAVGSPFLALPFLNAATGAESSTRIASPGEFSGFARQEVTSNLQGGELNGLYNLVRSDAWTVSLLGGFRYLNLQEQLAFTTSSPAIVGPADVFATSDRFNTNNNFYGGQIGARVERRAGSFFVNATGKVALGSMHQQVNIDGQLVTNDYNGFGAPQTFPGGYFTQPTNIGRQTNDHFAVVTDLNGSVGYQITRAARVSVGYSLLYISDVVRPGDQIDRQINPTQAPAFVGTPATAPGALVGPPAPLPQFNRTDFWAHGVNFSLELRY